MKAVLCPVCFGKGMVDSSFYDVHPIYYIRTAVTEDKCKSCGGAGYVVVPDG